MAGAYRLALARCQVVIFDSQGNELDTLRGVNVSIRDGTVKALSGQSMIAEMPVQDFEQVARRAYTVTGQDGTTWTIARKCGRCGH